MKPCIIKLVIFAFAILILLSLNVKTSNGADTDDNFNKIDQLIKSEMKFMNIPGLSIGIVKGNQIIYLNGYGKADSSGRKITPQTPFILGSISKSFTAMAIMQLIDKDKLELDKPVQAYLPWFRLADLEASKEITIRSLLGHTSGISTSAGSNILAIDKNMPLEQFIRQLKSLKLTKHVDTTFQYSNINYMILGEIVQTVSRLTYEEYIKLNIFKPLEMRHSYTSKIEAYKNGLAAGFQSFFGFTLPTDPPVQESAIPAGYLISSAEDMCHYLIANMNNGKYADTQILSEVGISQMHNRSSYMSENYGMGWVNLGNVIAHGGRTENFLSDMRMITDGDLGIVTLYNSDDIFMTDILKKDLYNHIPNAITTILMGKEIFHMSPPPNIHQIYFVIRIFTFLIMIFLLWSIYLLRYSRCILKNSRLRIFISALILLFFNIILPNILIIGIPKFLGVPWVIILRCIPGIMHMILGTSIVLILLGVIKIVFLSAWIKRRFNTKIEEV